MRLKYPNQAIWFFDPESVHEILVAQAASFRKSENYRALSPLLGESVITTDGETWRRQRRVIAPEFHESRVREFVPLMDQVTRESLAGLQNSRELKLQGFLCDWGFELASRAFFGQAQVAEPSKVAWLFNQGARGLFLNSVFKLRGRPERLNPWAKELARSLAVVDSWARELIRKRRSELAAESGCPFTRAQDVLGRIIHASSTGEGGISSDRELRDQAVSILMAGHDTTAISLFWAVHLLLRSPEWHARAREEAEHVADVLDYDALSRLPVIEQVIREAVRLYPAVNTMSREALEEVQICKLAIKKGQVVQLAPWVTHRHPRAWKDPSRFDPGRFSPEREVGIPQGAYFPFSLGPRTCVAQAFAMAQMKLFLVRLLNEFTLGPPRGPIPAIRPFLTLRPVGETILEISPRHGHA